MRTVEALTAPHAAAAPLRSYCAFGLRIDSQVLLDAVWEGDGGPADLSIVVRDLGVEIPGADAPPMFEFSAERQLLVWGPVGAFEICGDSISVQPAVGVGASLLALPLLGPVMALYLHLRGILVLHASAISVGDGGVVLMADKGTGKSTTAAMLLSKGHALLSDDLVAIEFDAHGQPFIVPSFPRLKVAERYADTLLWRADEGQQLPHTGLEPKRQYDLSHHFQGRPARLSRLYVLERGPQAQMQRLDTHAAFGALLRFSFISRFGSKLTASLPMRDHFRKCAALSNQSVSARLVVADNLGRAGEIEGQIIDDLARS
ncbi:MULTISPECIES: serine kinase [Mesorhizobium]|uniref:Serine kinase n=1 Tax=Mesorhizobium denitrificans TaxID=2294114 RepID=A0A371X9Q2_9HYPH|nr:MULTISPECIES: serine kinase [Mesorhizobium]RFC65764.1 serine kinase [Mesorhizobium denitrificans]